MNKDIATMKTIGYTKILNIDALSITEKQLLEMMDSQLESKSGNGVLVTPNLDHLVKLQRDKAFYDCYKKAQWVTCDSRILQLFSKLLKRPFPEAIPGSSFFSHFYEHEKHNVNCKIFILGAMDGVALEAQRRINEKAGRQIVVGAYSPSYGFEKKEEENKTIYEIINKSGANVVLVGVGCPKQEKWIFNHKDKMPDVHIWMALGATIDFEAGNIKRAPQIFQKLYLEWFYRFLMEPKRMFKRYFIDDMLFFYYFAKQLLGIYRNPFGHDLFAE